MSNARLVRRHGLLVAAATTLALALGACGSSSPVAQDARLEEERGPAGVYETHDDDFPIRWIDFGGGLGDDGDEATYIAVTSGGYECVGECVRDDERHYRLLGTDDVVDHEGELIEEPAEASEELAWVAGDVTVVVKSDGSLIIVAQGDKANFTRTDSSLGDLVATLDQDAETGTGDDATATTTPTATTSESSAVYGLHELTTTGEDDDGYRVQTTVRIGGLIRATDTEAVRRAWRAVGGSDDDVPTVEEVKSRYGTSRGVSVSTDDLLFAFGTVSFKNQTSGFSFTEGHPYRISEYHGAAAKDYLTFGAANETGHLFFGRMNLMGDGQQRYRYAYANEGLCLARDEGRAIDMTRDGWGPLPFMVTCLGGAATPANGGHDPLLDELTFKLGDSEWKPTLPF